MAGYISLIPELYQQDGKYRQERAPKLPAEPAWATSSGQSKI